MNKALIIMTRVPVPGKTKTRLMGFLDREHCAMLHTAFLKDIYKTCRETSADVFIFFTPVQHSNILRGILGSDARLYPQEGMDLGERMSNAISKCLAMGYESCVLIGSDIPSISAPMLEEAFIGLEDRDIVIAPTYDGGYCLIGMKNSLPVLFSDNFYGTGSVYEKTVSTARTMKLSIGEMAKCLDIDVEEDVMQLVEDIKQGKQRNCTNTIEFLRAIQLLQSEESVEECYGANDN